MSWKSVNLGDAYWFQEGPGVRNWQFTDNGIKLINVANIEKLGQINLAKTSRHLSVEEVEAKYKHFLCDAGDLVIASSGISFDEDGFLRTRGAFIKDEHLPLCLNTSTIRFKPKNSNDLIFFKHWLQSLNFRRQITKLVTGSAQQNFGPSHLKQLKIPLPPLPEQKRIAAILDKADELKRKREAAITKLDQLAQSIFVEMFGDVIVNDKGWQILRLGDVGTLDRGVSKHRPRNAPELLGGDYPLVQTGEVANCDGYIRSHNSSYSELGLRQSKIWPAGTLCITIAANIAKTGILTFDACFPDSVVGFRADNAATVEYVRVWLSFLQKMLEESAPESAQKNINLAILRELSIPFPPITLQEEFRNRLKAMQTLKVKFSTALAKQNNLFTSLQHQAFAGQLVP